jgi:hypothetical protein
MPTELQAAAGPVRLTITIGSFRGEPALGFYRLILSVKVSSDADPRFRARLRGLVVEAKVGNHFLGCFRPTGPALDVPLNSEFGSTEFDVELELRKEQVEAIENIRTTANFGLLLKVGFQVVRLQDDLAANIWCSPQQQPISQSEWTELLRAMEYADYVLLEIPIPKIEQAPHFKSAVTHLQRAQTAQFEGRMKDAVAACGDCLESLSTALKDKDQVAAATKSRQHDLWKRVQVLRQGLFYFSHLGRHADEVAESIEWTRKDVVALIAMTAAMLKWCADEAHAAEQAR